MKRLIICNDGTWNTPDQEANGIPCPTNVVKLHHALADSDDSPVAAGKPAAPQLKYYHPGVGTAGFLDSITGGAFGKGIDNHIRSAYHWIATHYANGDEIFLFGFSRGAFAARSLGGLLGRGLLDLTNVPLPADQWKRVEAAYQDYQTNTDAADRSWAGAWPFHHAGACPVRFLGVWDTVGALGIPDDLELLNFLDDPDEWRFHDTKLGAHVQTARHAMALDEIRASFTVTRWENAHLHPDAREVWFPGVHSDVGGGYAETDLSDGALLWMIDEGEAAGLRFRPDIRKQIKPDPLGVLHNSYKGAFAKLRSRPRRIECFTPANHVRFHDSAIARQSASPIAYPSYYPTHVLDVGESVSVDVFAGVRWNRTGLYLAAGHRYIFSATGEWLDSKDACDWKGTEDGKLTKGDIVRAAGAFLGLLENVHKRITKNPSTDFLGTKRVENKPWFVLIGAIANDAGPDSIVPNDGSPAPHEYVSLPEHEITPLEIKRPGYLFCFPNDVWSLYDNNRGSVRLAIKRVA